MVHESNAPVALPLARPDRAGARAAPPPPSAPGPSRSELPSLRWPEDVAHVRWPSEADRRAELVRQGRPRLLHVEIGVEPPTIVDELEDWVRTPADAIEVVVRATTVSERFQRGGRDLVVDDDGVFRVGSRWVALSPSEAVLARALVDQPGVPLPPEAIQALLGVDSGPNAVRVTVHRLRRRLQAVGVAVRNLRGRGFLIERAV
jgi:two-component system OmpR family response regulator/two-component system response regulator QseB